jgi:hypothetical protein
MRGNAHGRRGDDLMGDIVSNRRTRANSAPLNARVTLDLANRLRQHLADQGCGNLSDFVTAAIEEKLARDALDMDAALSTRSGPKRESIRQVAPAPMNSLSPKRRLRFKRLSAGQLANWPEATAATLTMD